MSNDRNCRFSIDFPSDRISQCRIFVSTNATALSSIDFSSIFQGILAVPRPFTAPRVVADSGSGGKACPEMDPIPGYEKVALTDGEGMMWHCFTH